MRKKGFTLAEVLITLSIIGVVAALTIPTVTRKFEKQQYISQYKETFSIISQAAKMVAANNGGSLSGVYTGSTAMQTAFEPYLKINKSCNNIDPTGICMASSYTSLDNQPYTIVGPYTGLILANGTSLYFKYGDATSSTIWIDLNGLKGPNVIGKDVHFVDVYTADGRVAPWLGSDPSTLCPSDLKTCANINCGQTCGTRILNGDYATNY